LGSNSPATILAALDDHGGRGFIDGTPTGPRVAAPA
jgi:hypothetical protein